jgi:NADP-dependent 3-hydroxy acid dehydrogenase YdfG
VHAGTGAVLAVDVTVVQVVDVVRVHHRLVPAARSVGVSVQLSGPVFGHSGHGSMLICAPVHVHPNYGRSTERVSLGIMTPRPTALITGASRGIGAAVAAALAPTHHLLLGGRDVEALKAVAATFPSATPWPVELTDPAAVAEAAAAIDRLDALVHSAGVAQLGSLAETPVEVWRTTFEVNVVAVAELTRHLLPALRAAAGQVVLINSGAGQRANPNWGAYAASKFALRAFADVLRAEEPQLRVTTVYPGRTATDMQRSIRASEGSDYVPNEYLTPETVAQAVAFALLAPPDAHVHDVSVRPRPH